MTQPLVPAVLPALEMCRTIEGRLGMRVYTVKLRRRFTSGERPGVGGYTDLPDVLIQNVGSDGFTCPVHVKQLSRQDVLSSGGRYQAGDWRVGPMTPQFAEQLFNYAAGYTDATLDPAPTGSTVEVFWVINGPSLPRDSIMVKVGEEATAFHYNLIMRMTGQQV